MFQEISYYLIFGKPLIMYLGITTLTLFLVTASVGILIMKGKEIPFSWHRTLAVCAIALAIVHGLLGITAYF
jgi:DMSO/TMAO reductase YedYZ heme-binding membrane subunit